MDLTALQALVRARRDADPDQSYVARLRARGVRRIAQKVGEEAVETAIAAASGDRDGLVGEVADLIFHLAVLLDAHDLSFDQVMDELARREGVSGLAEKAARRS